MANTAFKMVAIVINKGQIIIFEQTDKAIYRVDNQWSSKKKGIKRKIL